MRDTRPLRLFVIFFTLGATAFGGPAAHIAVMEDVFVRRRAWLTREAFLDLVAVANVLPGPTSTELALHIGFVRGGLPGLLAAGLGFILPGALLTAALASAYVASGDLPIVEQLLYGLKPVALAVVAAAGATLVPAGVRTRSQVLAFAGSLAAAAGGVHEVGVLAVGAFLGVAAWALRRPGGELALFPVAPLIVSTGPGFAVAGPVAPLALFGVFLKVGALLFGSGYVLFAFLNAEIVERLHWLSPQALLDAIAVGQLTPGPVFTTATFIGYVLDGPRGALVASVGIFLPAFVFVAASGPLVRTLRASAPARAGLEGVVAASLALLVLVCVALASSALVDAWTWALALATVAILLVWRISPMWCLLAGAVIGLAVARLV